MHAVLAGTKGNREQVARRLNRMIHPGIGKCLRQRSLQLFRTCIERAVKGIIGEFEGRNAGCNRERITRERTRLVDRTGRCQMLHHLTFTGECGDRHTAADHFTEGENIGNPAVIFGSKFTPVPGRRDTETGQHLIKNQQGIIALRNFAQAAVKARFGSHHAHIAGGGFGNDGGNFSLMRGESLAHGVKIVVGEHDSFGCGRRGHARRAG